jgi:hypothetical protein
LDEAFEFKVARIDQNRWEFKATGSGAVSSNFASSDFGAAWNCLISLPDFSSQIWEFSNYPLSGIAANIYT